MRSVSFIVAAYNAAETLEAAVRSAQRQRDVTAEIIVIDDHSTDATASVAQALARSLPNVLVVSTTRNSGPAAARNVGFALATGDWVAVVDADDELIEERLSTMCNFAENGGYDVVIDNQYVVKGAGNVAPSSVAFAFAEGPVDLPRLISLTKSSAQSLGIGYSKPVFRREALRRVAARYDERIQIGEDWLLLFECAAGGLRIGYTDWPGYIYRRGPASLTLGSGNTFAVVARLYAHCARRYAGDAKGVKAGLWRLSAVHRYKAVVFGLRILAGRAKAALRNSR